MSAKVVNATADRDMPSCGESLKKPRRISSIKYTTAADVKWSLAIQLLIATTLSTLQRKSFRIHTTRRRIVTTRKMNYAALMTRKGIIENSLGMVTVKHINKRHYTSLNVKPVSETMLMYTSCKSMLVMRLQLSEFNVCTE